MRLVLAAACVAFVFMMSGCGVYSQAPVSGWLSIDSLPGAERSG